MQLSPPAIHRVRGWVRGALCLKDGVPWAPEENGKGDLPLEDLVEAVRRHRVAEVIGSQASALGVPEPLIGPIEAIRTAGRRAMMLQVLETDRLQNLLAEAGIACMAIKGPALAVQTAGDPAARGPGDVDLLVDLTDVETAHRLLLANGWTIRPTYDVAPGTWAWDHVLRAFNALTYDGPGSAVDLHWRLDPTFDALPTFAEAWERRVPVDLGGGVQVQTLCHADLLAHTSLHNAKDNWRWMRGLVDVHRLAADPRTWERSAGQPLRKLELRTLAVTRELVGLPPTVPGPVLDQLDRVPAKFLERARVAQDRPVAATYPFPGFESMRLLRYMVAASSTRRDLRHSAVATVLPVKAVIGVEAKSAWTGVPLTLWHRILRLRRRSVAWVKREPGAGVVDPLVRSQR